ncbi:MAG: S41 family peptidase [Rikenellaceae bacterium]
MSSGTPQHRLSIVIIVLLSMMSGIVGGLIVSRNSSQRHIVELLRSSAASSSLSGPANKLDAMIELIEGYYVDSIQVDTLIEAMMPRLIEQLDPHSSYIPAKDLSKVNESLDGEFDGIGVVFNMATDTVIVLSVITAGPSAKAGLMARDRIITINDSIVAGRKLSQDYVVSQLRGERGTKVRLGLERGGIEGLVDVEVTRDKIPINSISSAFMIKKSVGYIRLDQFARTTYREFLEAINRLGRQGMSSLILDLRGNSGGFMDQAIHLANEFLPKNALIVYTEGRSGEQSKEYSSRDGQLQDLPLVVLVDEFSASSSEILAGALQDNDKGTLIGRRSFGKGLVQQQIPFTDGSAVRLTVARYYTPTGRSIQKPYKMGDNESYERELADRIAHEELFTADSILFVDSLKRFTAKGKVVYGGGGIMPDIFVPLSKEELPKFFTECVGRNILYRYTIEYSDRHRDDLAKVESFEQLDELFNNDKSLVDDFVQYAIKEGIEEDKEQIEASRRLFEHQLRAYIGRNTKLEDNGYYANIYPLDDVLMRALSEIESGNIE